jgi:hypothetical protein
MQLGWTSEVYGGIAVLLKHAGRKRIAFSI